MADARPKTSGKGVFDTLGGLGKVFGFGKTPDPKLVGEPALPATERLYRERLATMKSEERVAYGRFMDAMPIYQRSPDTNPAYKDEVVLPMAEIAFSSGPGKKKNNEDGLFVDPLRDIGLVVDGLSHGGNGTIAAKAILETFQAWTSAPERVEAELRAQKIKNTPGNRLKLIGHKAHEAARRALGEKEGGAAVAGTMIEGSKLYSFTLGDAVNMVIRDDKVVFCSRPTSRLQRFVEVYGIPPVSLRKSLDEYLANTPVEKIRSELGYPKNIELDTIKRTIWSDPIKVLGFDDVDMSVEEFDLHPDDTIISVTDGILDPLGLRVIPTAKDKKTGSWKFDPGYNSLKLYGLFDDPLLRLGGLLGRSAVETRDKILQLFEPRGPGARGEDHQTILVRRQPLPPIPPDPDEDRTEYTKFTPTGPSGGNLSPIGPDYAEEKTPVDEARRHLPRPPEEPIVPPPPLVLPPRLGATPPPPRLAPLPWPEHTGPIPLPRGGLPSVPDWVAEATGGPLPVPIAPAPPLSRERAPSPPPLPLPPWVLEPPAEDEWPPLPSSLPPIRTEIRPPAADVLPLRPSPEDEAQRLVITRLKEDVARLALREYDTRHVAKNEQMADALLWTIWDIQDRLAVLERKLKPVRPAAEKMRVRKNFLRNEIATFEQSTPRMESDYASQVQKKHWYYAFDALAHGLHAGRIRQIEQSYSLAWLEGQFELLKEKPFRLVDEKGVMNMRVAEVFPSTDPDMANVVVMHVLGPDGKPTKRMALTKHEWQRKLEQGADLVVPRETFPLEASKLIREVKQAADGVRLWFKAGNFMQKLDQGRFAGTAYEPLYTELRTVLARYPEGYTPASSVEALQPYTLWADDIEDLQTKIQDLTNPKI